MSDAEEALAFQLKAHKIPFEREVRFAPPRRWRFDFRIQPEFTTLAVEVDGGSWTGGHRHGDEADKECEKMNAALMTGWRVLHFTPAMVDDGRAIDTIQQALR